MIAKPPATIEDLYKVKTKAELVNGEIVHFMPTGFEPGYAALEITISLRNHQRRTKKGFALGDNQAFLVELPNRKSFSPDAAYYEGPNPGMKFFDGAPLFAAEVRSEGDYGPKAERDMAAKRADYFRAGTVVVWDVDLDSDEVVKKYSVDDPDSPTVFRRGEMANAEPSVAGWSMPVDDLFESPS